MNKLLPQSERPSFPFSVGGCARFLCVLGRILWHTYPSLSCYKDPAQNIITNMVTLHYQTQWARTWLHFGALLLVVANATFASQPTAITPVQTTGPEMQLLLQTESFTWAGTSVSLKVFRTGNFSSLGAPFSRHKLFPVLPFAQSHSHSSAQPLYTMKTLLDRVKSTLRALSSPTTRFSSMSCPATKRAGINFGQQTIHILGLFQTPPRYSIMMKRTISVICFFFSPFDLFVDTSVPFLTVPLSFFRYF
jgi:hypothetical protein